MYFYYIWLCWIAIVSVFTNYYINYTLSLEKEMRDWCDLSGPIIVVLVITFLLLIGHLGVVK
jgi:hypothetical protein